MLAEATTTVVGMKRATSSAWLGPERTARRERVSQGISCSRIWLMRISEPCSTPLVSETTMGLSSSSTAPSALADERSTPEGTATTTSSASFRTCGRLVENFHSCGTVTPFSVRSSVRVSRRLCACSLKGV